MKPSKSLKEQITEAVLAEIPKELTNDHDFPIDSLLSKWWFTKRQSGLRLTDDGVVAFTLAEIEYFDYTYSLSNQGQYRFLIDLDKKIKCPYYLGLDRKTKPYKPFIRFYDSKIAMWMSLHGSLSEYLSSINLR